MKISANLNALKRTSRGEYLLRFGFGGLVTVVAGVIAHLYGPVVGGLFLAFPAIFPASATLVQNHEKADKQRHGHDGRSRGKNAAGVDAVGAMLGSIGLVAFAIVMWLLAEKIMLTLALAAAFLSWLIVAIAAWYLRKCL